MLKNKVQFQPGYSLLELFKDYGTEQQCAEALFNEGVHGSVVNMQGHPTRRQVIWAVVHRDEPRTNVGSRRH